MSVRGEWGLPQRAAPLAPALVLVLAAALLFTPKVNLVRFESTTIGVKPEDLLVAVFLVAALGLAVLQPSRLRTASSPLLAIAGLALLYLVLVTAVTLWYEGNLLFVARYGLYFAMLLFAWLPITEPARLSRRIESLALVAILLHLAVAALQRLGRIGGFLVGNFTPEVSDRVNAVFSNAVEFGAVSVLLLGLVLGSGIRPAGKVVALAAVVLSNILAKNRVGVFAILMVLIAYSAVALRGSGMRWGRIRLVRIRSRHLVILAILLTGLVLPYLRFLPRLATLYAFENVQYATSYIADHVTTDAELVDIEAQLAGGGPSVDESLAMRVQRWTYVLSLIASGHLLGVGAGNVGQGADGFAFRILGESGLLGLVLYGILLTLLFLLVRTPVGFLPGLRYGYLSLLVHALAFDIFYFSRIGYLFWLLIGLRLAVPRFARMPGSA